MDKDQSLNWAVASVIREARESAKLSQTQLAGLAGLSEKYISKVERGTINISLAAFNEISRVLEIPREELMRRISVLLKKGVGAPPGKIGRPKKE